LRIDCATFRRELLPRSAENVLTSAADGARPRASLKMRLIQPAFVEPASAKYSGEAAIWPAIC